MNTINEAVMNHLNMQTNGALMITGDWGSGKTFYIKEELFPLIEKKGKFKPLMVSVYGEKDKESIAQRIVFNYWSIKSDRLPISFENLFQGLTKFAASLPIVNKYVNIEKILMGNGNNLLKLLPKNKLVICFDDVERISDKMDINDFLGLVNELVENQKTKVIIIANDKMFRKSEENEKQNEKIIYVEKTVEKTIHYVPNIQAIYVHIIDGYPNTLCREFMKTHEEWFVKTLLVDDFSDFKELKISLANIRTIKFAIEHYRLAFEAITSTKNPKEKEIIEQLKSVWLFTLAISIEFRKGNRISFEDSKNLESVTLPLADLDFQGHFLASQESKIGNQSGIVENNYPNEFEKYYFNRLGETFRFYREIYRLITGGVAIESTTLNKDLDEKFYIDEGSISPAQELLSKFLYGYYRFTDDEFLPAVKQLMIYTREGKLNDIISYLNAGVYLFNFSEYFQPSKNKIEQDIKDGLLIHIKSSNTSFVISSQLDMVAGNFVEEHLQRIVSFTKLEVKIKEEQEFKDEIRRMEDLFINDLSAFVKELLPKNPNSRSPDKLLFNQFDLHLIDDGIYKWNPEAIMNLTSYLKIRYSDFSFAERLTEEIPFLEKLKERLGNVNQPDKILSTDVINKQLIPMIDKCVDKLNKFKQHDQTISNSTNVT